MVQQVRSPAETPHSAARQGLLRGLKEHLRTGIKGQEHIIERVCSVLIRGELGLAHPRRPKGSFLFVGPTGVGKTETTNVFTHYLFAGAVPLRFDMSEYQLQKSVDKLIGENFTDPGLLGDAVRRCPRGTLLFDEIEKAHPLVLDLFLQILEDARITLATGETLNLNGFYVVCTSNIGSAEAMRMESAPFASVERTVLARVAQTLRSELGGRVTDKLVFARLDYATQRSICEGMVDEELRRLRSLGHDVAIAPGVMEFLVRRGYHRALGARPMRGTVERFLQDAIAATVLEGDVAASGIISVKDDRLIVLSK
jgi:ATP-dependent Clp protease ATP-binding subunit ClpA